MCRICCWASQDFFNLKSTDLVATLPTAKKQMIEIAKAISQNAKIIILDEPTNHLDIESITWLEEYLKNCRYKTSRRIDEQKIEKKEKSEKENEDYKIK